MKHNFHLLILTAVVLFSLSFVSCSDDDFGPSIFDTTEYYLDKSSYTFPLDTFLKVEYLEPYNLDFKYKMEDIGADMDKNLVPASYEKSIDMAVLAKYLWFEVYKKCISEEFLKIYSPRIIHLIGSPSYNPTSGTETLGEAEGGIKITLYNVNHLDVDDIDEMNEKFFKTMHHEFSHIMAQNYTYPTAFSLISNGVYNPIDWAETSDSVAISKGFVSPYASSQAREDWVEVIANYIVKDYGYWERMLDAATYDWEQVVVSASWFDSEAAKCDRGEASRDSVGYFAFDNGASNSKNVASTSSGSPSQYNIQRKCIQRDADDNPILSDGKMVYLSQDVIDGREVILEKLEMCKEWLETYFDADLDKIRDEVQLRQWLTDDDGNFVFDSNGNYINRLTSPAPDNVSETLIDELRDQVYKYEALQP